MHVLVKRKLFSFWETFSPALHVCICMVCFPPNHTAVLIIPPPISQVMMNTERLLNHVGQERLAVTLCINKVSRNEM